MPSKKIHDSKIAEKLSDTKKITRLLQEGINRALLRHKQAGNPVCEWQNGKVVWIEAKDIKIKNK